MSMRSRPMMDSYNMHMSGVQIKFRRKGGFRSGISLGEAMANVRLSSNDEYTFNDLNVDGRGRVILKIRVRTATSMLQLQTAEDELRPRSGRDTPR